MSEIPTGTVIFLFTDIEGSTKRWETNRAAMSVALRRHDAILRGAIEISGGHVFKTVGDAFCAAFTSAVGALDASLAAQRDLAAEDWAAFGAAFGDLRVRMGLHVGEAELADGDYFGRPLNRVARLMGAGHGGQVLLSAAVQELVRDDLPAGASLRDLGEHRLKDLARPERVFQLVVPDLRADFPRLHTLDARPHNLPVQVTSFVGRERELAEIHRLLGEARLLTLTGVGGTGKTRLALQTAAEALDGFEGGAWLVDLSPLVDETLVVPTVAAVLGLREAPGRPTPTRRRWRGSATGWTASRWPSSSPPPACARSRPSRSRPGWTIGSDC